MDKDSVLYQLILQYAYTQSNTSDGCYPYATDYNVVLLP